MVGFDMNQIFIGKFGAFPINIKFFQYIFFIIFPFLFIPPFNGEGKRSDNDRFQIGNFNGKFGLRSHTL